MWLESEHVQWKKYYKTYTTDKRAEKPDRVLQKMRIFVQGQEFFTSRNENYLVVTGRLMVHGMKNASGGLA